MLLLVGLGGNLGDPPATFARALAALADDRRVLARSRLYRSDPVGPPQPRYWNAAALVATGGDLLAVLADLQGLEAAAGRSRDGERWGPRPLDLDLLMAEALVHRGPRLEVPHPQLHRRAFALAPAAELAADWVHPLLGATLGELAAGCDASGVEVADRSW